MLGFGVLGERALGDSAAGLIPAIAGTGVYVLTGRPAILLAPLRAEAGSYQLTGHSVAAHPLKAVTGVYQVRGRPTVLIVSFPAPPEIRRPLFRRGSITTRSTFWPGIP